MKCRRPKATCYCGQLPHLQTATRVLIVQHPRERDMPIGTARMAHLSLPNSKLVQGISLDEHPALADLLATDDVALLYPGEGARPAEEWAQKPPGTLVVIDGTWWQAKKVLKNSPKLASLPRISLKPAKPGNYRIRKEPTEHHLSTVEAVSTTLGILEGNPERFAQMLNPFDFMVDGQIEHRRRRQHRDRKRAKRPRVRQPELARVLVTPQRAVIVYAEANAHALDERAPGAPEMLHLVAIRPHTGERFSSILKPRRPLGRRVPKRLGIEDVCFVQGEKVADFLNRWDAFLGPDSELCAWGHFPRDLLQQETGIKKGFVDLRGLTARSLGTSAGGIEKGALRLAGQKVGTEPRRADRMLALLEAVYRALLEKSPPVSMGN